MSVAIDINHVPLATVDQSDIKQICAWPRGGLAVLDAGENRFFQRELEFIIPELTEFEHAPINARRVFPIDRRAGPGAEVITFRQITQVGVAKVMADYSDDIPKADVFGEEFKGSVRSLASSAEWSLQEIRNASLANVPLDREKTEAAREVILRLENTIAFSGDAKHGLVGLLTAPNIPTFTAPNGAGGFPQWDTKTGSEIVDDLNALVNAIIEDTNGVEIPNTVLLPIEQYNLAITKRMETGTDTTALQFFVRNSPYIASESDVMPVQELAGAGPAGVDIGVAYDRNQRKLHMNVALDIESFAPEVRGFKTSVIYHERFGGLTVKKPLSLNIIEDI